MNKAFADALSRVGPQAPGSGGIGTLGEKSVHAVLKHYFQPDAENHEVKIGSYYTDLIADDGIFEIQTGGFQRLAKKLTELLAVTRVTVVYPISRRKTLCQLDPETHAVLSRRKSPLKGSHYQVFGELIKIKTQLLKPNFALCLVLLDVCEYRVKQGRKSLKLDRVPTDLIEELYFFTPEDYRWFLPAGLPQPFDCAQLAAACAIPYTLAQAMANVLAHLGLLLPDGLRGRRKLYSISKQDPDD